VRRNIYLNGEYARQNPTFAIEDSPWKARQVLKAIERNRLSPNTICEVGCGAGEILRQLQNALPPHVVFEGYDISPDSHRAAQTRENDRLKFFCADFAATSGPAHDLLLCLDVFEHVPDYLGFLEKLRLRAEYKVFHIPLDLSVQWLVRMKPILKERATVGHLHHFTRETALETLEWADYQIIDSFYTAGALDLPDKSFKQKLARVPRRLAYRLSPDLTVRILGGYALLVVAR
jgi:trans-aconitate methyltransferase